MLLALSIAPVARNRLRVLSAHDWMRDGLP